MRTFNSDFYTAAALVIPIFFLGLMFPDGILFKYWHSVEKWHNKKDTSSEGRNSFKRIGRQFVYAISIIPPLFMLAAGGISETIALLALNDRNATAIEHAIVLIFFIPMPAAAVLCVMVLVTLQSMDET